MSSTQKPKPKKGPSVFSLETTRRLRISWTRWRLKRMSKKYLAEERRLHLMQVQLDAQLLYLQELDQLGQILKSKEQELVDSSRYRLLGQLPPSPEAPNPELDQLLGISGKPDPV